MPEAFAGAGKVGKLSILGRLERRFIDATVPKLPSWLRSWHLTLMTLPICLGIVGASALAASDIRWLWVVSAFIAAQWLTDSLDGSLGKYRKEGLVRWGYYMDHFLDYLFLCSIVVGYALFLPAQFVYVQLGILAIFGAFMASAFLAYGATNGFQIVHAGIGPTEIRLAFIAVNILLATFGTTHLAFLLPYILALAIACLAALVYRTQKKIWEMDMAAKREAGE
jgi:phosphatidylglycerophosphate synthase